MSPVFIMHIVAAFHSIFQLKRNTQTNINEIFFGLLFKFQLQTPNARWLRKEIFRTLCFIALYFILCRLCNFYGTFGCKMKMKMEMKMKQKQPHRPSKWSVSLFLFGVRTCVAILCILCLCSHDNCYEFSIKLTNAHRNFLWKSLFLVFFSPWHKLLTVNEHINFMRPTRYGERTTNRIKHTLISTNY